MTLLGIMSPRGFILPRPGGDGSFAAWNGSNTSLPVAAPVTKQSTRPPPRERRKPPRFLVGEAYTAVLLGQALAVLALIGFLGVRIVGHRDKSHFESWNILWNRACPPLLLLLSLFLTALLLHLINRLTSPVLLGIQAAAAFLSTLCGLVLVVAGLGSSDVDDDLRGDFSGLAAVVAGAVIIWIVSFLGFLQAFWAWTRVPAQLRRTERGYGTTSGGLAVEEDGLGELLDG